MTNKVLLCTPYLAFIRHYTKLHGRSPSETEMQGYFRVTPPSVHQMVVTLESRGLISRTPGKARSIHRFVLGAPFSLRFVHFV